MKSFDASSEAEWLAETIVDDFALGLDLAERVRFYSRLVELLIQRRDQMQHALEGGDAEEDSLEHIH
jgi:hypothetical protein